VEGTDQRVLASALLVGDHARAAMPADVVKTAHDAVLATHDQGPLTDHVHGQVVTFLGHVRNVADDLPVGAEQVLLLEFEKGGTVIGPAREAAAIPIVGDRIVGNMRVHDRSQNC